jgi:hypothetical protein
LTHHAPQQVPDGAAENRMMQTGRHFNEWFQDKAPFSHTRMRNLEMFRPNDEFAEEQNVDINRPRTLSH